MADGFLGLPVTPIAHQLNGFQILRPNKLDISLMLATFAAPSQKSASEQIDL